MNKRSRMGISSSVYGKAFLAKAWEARGDLLEYERRGFAQFFYLTLCGHIEAILVNRIKKRLRLICLVNWENLGHLKYINNEKESLSPIEPLVSSIKHIADGLSKEAENAPISKLMTMYSEIFPDSLPIVLGKDLLQDLNALATLRNIFAHGRDLIIEFEHGDGFSDLKGTLDDNPLKFPAQRLQAAGIIKSFDIKGHNHDEFMALFFSDEAMLHFYNVVKQAEAKIKEFGSSPIEENTWQIITDLPELSK